MRRSRSFRFTGTCAGAVSAKLVTVLRAIGKVLGWRLGGKAWPHPFFARDTRAPLYPITVISREEREALRPLCGPKAATVS